MPSPRVLFILKLGHEYQCGYSHSSASGLRNSARFVVDFLHKSGIEAKLVQVLDNNFIDREVTLYKPTHVVIEAFWVVPEKFDVLSKLHPEVKWVIRCHSDLTFLATEGMAIEWIKEYLTKPNVYVAFNAPKIARDARDLLVSWHSKRHVLYLPNVYPNIDIRQNEHQGCLRVGCFGAVRPMKNQLLQAVAAIRYADISGKRLEFYMNATRCEQGGNSVLSNVRALFAGTRHALVEVPWIDDHKQFLNLMREMDYSLCVSLSETFCITAADAVACNVTLIGSKEIPWISKTSVVDVTDSDDIVDRMSHLTGLRARISKYLNRLSLRSYSEKSERRWLKYLINFAE